MISLIEENRDAIVALREQYGAQSLAVVGSAVKGTLDSASSNVDFAIEILDYGSSIARRYLGLIAAIEQLFRRAVDVVTIHAGARDAFREELERTAVNVYERNAGVA